MNEFDGNFMEQMLYCASSSSQSPITMLAMLNQSDDDLNPIVDRFPQTYFSKNCTEQKSILSQRLAARICFNLPTIETKNINNHFSEIFRNTAVHSPVLAISPGFSPSAIMESPKTIPLNPITSNGPPILVESVGETYATKITFDNELYRLPLHVDQSFQEGFDVIPTKKSICIPSFKSHVDPIDALLAASFESEVIDDIISMEEESDKVEEDDVKDEDEKNEDDNDIFDNLDINPSCPKRRRFEMLSNMTEATRTSTQQRVIIQMECEENNPDDGFRWRKYGQKFVKGNLNPRSYYECNMYGCNVKKHVERGAYNPEIVVITYDGIHEHATPISRGSYLSPQNRFGSSSLSQNDTNQTGQLCKTLSPSFTASKEETSSFPSLGLHIDMTKFYKTGLFKLPSLPINLNLDFIFETNEPKIDVMLNGIQWK